MTNEPTPADPAPPALNGARPHSPALRGLQPQSPLSRTPQSLRVSAPLFLRDFIQHKKKRILENRGSMKKKIASYLSFFFL